MSKVMGAALKKVNEDVANEKDMFSNDVQNIDLISSTRIAKTKTLSPDMWFTPFNL